MRYYALIYNIFYINKIEICSPLCIKHTIVHRSFILWPKHQSRGILLSKWLVPHVSKTGSHPFWAVADAHGNRTDTGEKKKKKHNMTRFSESAVNEIDFPRLEFQSNTYNDITNPA